MQKHGKHLYVVLQMFAVCDTTNLYSQVATKLKKPSSAVTIFKIKYTSKEYRNVGEFDMLVDCSFSIRSVNMRQCRSGSNTFVWFPMHACASLQYLL